jgi:citrate lyase beta subunit
MWKHQLRSLLFVPAHDERKLIHALTVGADAIIVDLEDSVPASEKDRARTASHALARLQRGTTLLLVRINPVGGSECTRDLAALAAIAPDAIVVPKATPDAVAALGAAGAPLIALIETAEGLRCAYETARSRRVAALALGAADLAADTGLQPRADGLSLLHARSKLVIDSAAAGLPQPFDAVQLQLAAPLALARECRLARSLGMGGKLCIHPHQVGIVNRMFAPTPRERAWARRAVAAYAAATAQGRGAVTVDGALVDAPVHRRAEQLLCGHPERS